MARIAHVHRCDLCTAEARTEPWKPGGHVPDEPPHGWCALDLRVGGPETGPDPSRWSVVLELEVCDRCLASPGFADALRAEIAGDRRRQAAEV